eukprot:CAMPEP_0181194416 /NCGR_PEP_ID=MMETSP1096-20121128/14328_1 /TAXON_ID=156174 ORGANISM="Chrysochromulina ericina, Strain CCMP281" /NCGR_SAMPLE_ID=MMETSP1096 /ASSEMBLY_ACC=CAM_ASM_000453 /LENGTH=84 /DNA_ID=CAMNT_0023283923 /DNA_START=1152 /DNA_END=1403 /DNA_ORIENTATION=+
MSYAMLTLMKRPSASLSPTFLSGWLSSACLRYPLRMSAVDASRSTPRTSYSDMCGGYSTLEACAQTPLPKHTPTNTGRRHAEHH